MAPSDGEWGAGPTPLRPLGVWLPGLKRVSKLLNGTAGVRRVASSKVHRIAESRRPAVAPPDEATQQAAADGTVAGGDESGGEGDGAAGDAAPGGVRGMRERLVVRFAGQGNYGAHRLRATYRNNRGLRTQELYISCEDGFSLAELREVLRALQPVLDFVLDEVDDTKGPWTGPWGGPSRAE